MLRIEVIIDARAELGEGPLWDVAEQRLYSIDSLGAKVHPCNAQGGAERSWSVPEHIGSLALREKGGAVASLRDGFYALDFANGACRKLADPDPGKARVRMNDGKVDGRGRFVAGYIKLRGARSHLRRVSALDPNGSVAKLDDGIVCSNGPCWSPDGHTFYFTDTYTREIWAYDYDMELARRPTAASSVLLPRGLRGCRTGDGRRRRVRLERVGLRGKTRPLRGQWPARKGRWASSRKHDQPQLRRT